MEVIFKILTAIADVFAIVAAGIAIYIFFAKRDIISSALRVLLNFSSQITLDELKAKLERLNDLSADDPDEIKDIVNILNEVVGQIHGSKNLSTQCNEVMIKIENMADDKSQLTEPRKRALISELRERLRNIDVDNYADFIGDKK